MKERRYFPLSPDEKVIMIWAGAAPAAMMNLAVQIEIESEIDEALFLQALQVTVERLPYVRCRLHDLPDGTVVQYISDMDEQTIPDWTDASGWPESKTERAVTKWAHTPFPGNMRDVQLFHAELLRKSGGTHLLYFCGHHIIMDIYAVVYFVTYLDKVYDALAAGTELPRPGDSPEAAVQSRIDYLQSRNYVRDQEWWQHAYPTEPEFTSVNGPGGHEYIKGKRYGRDRSPLQMKAKEKIFALTDGLEEAVMDYCKKNNTYPSVLFLFAVRCYLASVCQTDDVCLCLPIAARTTLLEKTSGLNMATGVCFRTDISRSAGFKDAISQMNRLNLDYMKHVKYPNCYGLLRDLYNTPQNYNYDSVMFSYVPFVDYSRIRLKIRASEISSGVALWPLYILVMHLGQGEGLKLVYRYSAGYVEEGSIDRCHAFLLHFMRSALEHPDRSIGELMDESFHMTAG